jgi:hypothetical protein
MGIRRAFSPPLLQKISYPIKSELSSEKSLKLGFFVVFLDGDSIQDAIPLYDDVRDYFNLI